MITARREIRLLFALFLLIIGSCQAGSEDCNEYEAKDRNNMLPLIYLLHNGAISVVATPGICLLSMLSLVVTYFFSRYA